MQKKVMQKQKALAVSIKEGSASSISSSIGETYISLFALALQAKAIHIGILSAISGLVSPIAQLLGSNLMEKFSRKKIILYSVFLQALFWIPIASLAFFYKGFYQSHLIFLLIIFYSIFSILFGFAYPAWFSWMGDLVPKDSRGKYFSRRNKITGAFGLAASIAVAFLLDFFKTSGLVLLGFSLLFMIAFAFRMLSGYYIKKQYEPPFKLKRGYYFSLWQFLKKSDNYGKFAIYQALFNLALMIASPFFVVYMRQDLQFNYVTIMAISTSSSIFYLLFTPLIGKFSDKFGNKRLLFLSGLLFSINPLLWLVIKSPLIIILIPQIIVGLSNACLVIAYNNFTYDSVSKKHRGLCIAYTNMLSGIGIFLGSLIGGFILNYASIPGIKTIFLIFIISAFGRLVISLLMLKLKEVKKVKPLPPMHLQIMHPFKSLNAEIGWIRHVLK